MIRFCLDDCTYEVSVPYKVINLLAVANMSEKTLQDLWGDGVHPWGYHENHLPLILKDKKPPSTHLKKWKILTIDAWDNFDNTAKKSFSCLEEQSQKSKKFVKGGGCTPPINLSPIKGNLDRKCISTINLYHKYWKIWKNFRFFPISRFYEKMTYWEISEQNSQSGHTYLNLYYFGLQRTTS